MISPTYTGAKFTKENRLTRSSQLYFVLKHGKRINCKWFNINILQRLPEDEGVRQRRSLAHCRLGIIIGKKIFKEAVDRNTFKRVAREFFRSHQRRFKKPYDIVISVYKKPRSKDKAFFLKEIK